MAQTNFTPILTYKSDTATVVPSAGNLTNSENGAELAVNTADKRLFTKDSGGNVVELGTNPSSLTLPNSTANGVVYANGSKVLTSGSALTFDGNTLKNDTASTTAANIRIENGTFNRVGSFALTASGIQFDAFDQNSTSAQRSYMWLSGGSEQMRLTSTGLGIGTSSPGAKLDVSGVVRSVVGSGQSFLSLRTSDFFYSFLSADGLDTCTNTNGAAPMLFKLGGSEQMRLDSSGSLGIGTSSPGYRLDARGNVAGGNGTIFTGLSWDTRGLVGTFSNHSLGFMANSTVRATLDTSGNLGLGVTPSAWVSTVKAFDFGNAGSLYAVDDTNLINNGYLDSGAVWRYKNGATVGASFYQQYNGQHRFYVAGSGTAGNPITFTQAMTLDASGNLIVGGTSALISGAGRGNITINGSSNAILTFGIGGSAQGYIYHYGTGMEIVNQTNTPLTFSTNNTERARIDSSGNLLAGTTSNPGLARIHASNGGNDVVSAVQTAAGGYCYKSNAFVNGGVYYHMEFQEAGTARGSITSNGSATSYNTSSDYRLKNITGPITTSGAYIDSLNPVEGTWKADGSTFVGLIAHEVQEASRTQVATGVKDGEQMQAMDYSSSEIIANLIAEVKSLRQRLAAAGI